VKFSLAKTLFIGLLSLLGCSVEHKKGAPPNPLVSAFAQAENPDEADKVFDQLRPETGSDALSRLSSHPDNGCFWR